MDFRYIISWGLIPQAIALVHFFQRRPESMWLWVILFFGPLGATIYIVVEVIPDLGLLRQSFDGFGRRKRIRLLEALVLQNPAAGNYEELADLYLDEEKFARARECYDKAISARTNHPDPFYRRAIAEIRLDDFPPAVRDLEWVTARDPKYDSYRAHGAARARATARSARRARRTRSSPRRPSSRPRRRRISTTPRSSPRPAARTTRANGRSGFWPRSRRCHGICGRVERPWFRKAAALIKALPAGAPTATT